jgi:hypothetical protein
LTARTFNFQRGYVASFIRSRFDMSRGFTPNALRVY